METDPRSRIATFIGDYFEMDSRIRKGEEPPIAVFSDARSLREPHLSRVTDAYGELFRKVRSLFQGPGIEWLDKRAASARTHLLMEQIYWSVVWLPRFDVDDYARTRKRMLDILTNGITPSGTRWAPHMLADIDRDACDSQAASRETFLTSATRLINQRGYRGASVEKISEQMNVTKGSFYHHNDAKDDLVVSCFNRSFSIMRRAQTLAMQMDGDMWCKVSSAAASLAAFQLSEGGPLLRTSTLSALPELIRKNMVERANRISVRFAGMISDGIADGSIRPVDPFIAAQMLNATLNATSAAASTIPNLDQADITQLYIKPILMGIFTP
jgi:AcrR family transcriptional regulator